MMSAGAAFAADDAALVEASDEMAIEENVLPADDIAVETDDVMLAEGNDDNIVTNETFHNYFDEYGVLRNNVTSDELIFEGDFSELDVGYIVIFNKSLTLTGSDAFLDGISFIINSDDVTIDGFTMTQTDVTGIYAEGDNIVISNNFIDFTALEDSDSYAINSFASNNLQLLNNTILYVGNTDGTVVNNAVRIAGDDEEKTPATSIVVSGNTFEIELPSVDVGYDPDTWESVVMSEGIVFYYCEDLKFMNNAVDLKYNNVTTKSGYDSLYAVSVKSDAYNVDVDDEGETVYPINSSGIVIFNNSINVEGHSAVYGVTVAADSFSVAENNITVTSEIYLGHAVDVLAPSFHGVVFDNILAVEAPAAYGIYSDGSWLGPVDTMVYADNYITVDGYLADGMELMEKNPYVTGNSILAHGNYTYGVVASIYEGGEISCNYIGVLGSNVGTMPTGDSLMPRNSMGISVKGNSKIAENTIASTNIGINLAGEGNITVDNNVLDVEANIGEIDNHAIVASELDDLVISNNEITYVGASGKTGGGTKDYAIYVSDSEVDVANNTMDIVVQSIPNDWIDDGAGNWVRKSYSEGLVFDGCDFSSVTGNVITLEYNGGSYGSIYAVDVLGCDNFLIDDNSIDATGESYIYGIIVEGDDFIISNNEIWTESEYYANGIDIEKSTGGLIDDNLVQSKAPGTVYPIYGGMVGEPSLEITNNEIYGNSYFVVGVELSGLDATINDNTIIAGGNYTIGIGVYVDELIAGNNTIICDASNVGNVSIWDSLGTDTTGIKSKKGTATIIDNEIEVKGKYSVDIADGEGTVHDNRLVAAKLLGDYSVYSTGAASVYDNYPTLKVVLFATDLDKVYGDGKLFTVTALDENGDPATNITLFAKAGAKWFYTVTDDKGVAEFDINLPEGTYAVRTIFYGTEVYGPREIENTLTVTAAESEIIAPELAEFFIAEVIAGNATYSLTLVDADGNAIADRQINITFNGLTEEFTTDENGTVVYVINATAGNYTIDMAFESDGCYQSAEASGSVVIKGEQKQAKIYLRNALYFTLENKIVNVTLWDADNNPIANKTVHITIGNSTWSGITDENGTAHIRVGIGFGNHNATVHFDGDDEYAAANRTGVVRVIKETPSVMVRGADTRFKVTDNPKTVNVYLWDRYGKPLPVGSKIAIKVNGQTYIGYTDSQGIASINIDINNAGIYNAEVMYGGNSAYNAVTRSVKFYIQ